MMCCARHVFLLLCLSCGWTAAEAAAPRAEARLEAAVTPYHRPARYTLIVQGDAIEEPRFPKLVIEGFEVREKKSLRESQPDGPIRYSKTYVLDALYPCRAPIPAVEITLGEKGGVAVPALVVEARALTAEEKAAAARLAPLATPSEIPYSRAWVTYVGIAGLCCLMAAGILAFYLFRTRRRAVPEVVRCPWDVAYQRLAALRARRLPEAGQFEVYYVDLTAILRYYLEDRFEIRAPEQTTPEFIEEAGKNRALSEDHRSLLTPFLRHCDRVKFAQHVPAAQEMERGIDLVERFVHDTEAKVEPEAGEEGPPA